MNGTPEIKVDSDEYNPTSLKSPPLPPSQNSSSLPGRPSSSLEMPPDHPSSRDTSTPDAYSVKSPPIPEPPSTRPSLSPTVGAAAARNPLASLQAAKRKRLPQDKVGQLEDRIALDVRDADAWLALIREHQAKGKISDARETYERFFKVFPDLVFPSWLKFRHLRSRHHSGEITRIWS